MKPPTIKAEVIRRRTLGESFSQIAVALDISVNTVKRIIDEGKTEDGTKNSVEKIFSQAGITPATIAAKFRELQEAKDVRLATFEGKFTDRVEVADGAVQFRATEATAKILGLFPKEDVNVAAQLFVRLPDIELTKGHGKICKCEVCCRAWEALPAESIDPNR